MVKMTALRYLTPEQEIDPRSLRGLVEYYQRAINNGLGHTLRRIAVNFGINPVDVPDLEQDFYVHLYQRAEKSPEQVIESPDSYIYSGFVNECRWLGRREVTRKDSTSYGGSPSDDIMARENRANGMLSLEERERLEAIMAVLDCLEPKLREPVMAHYYAGLTYSEASELLGMPRGTVQSRAYKGVRAIRASLGLEEP